MYKKNRVDVLLGLQWGDEGKGKIIDALTPEYDIIARFQGGPNAGHSIEFDKQKHVLHLIPSGIFHMNKMNILGNGMVICPIAFKKEIEELLAYIPMEDLRKRIVIADGAKLILPIHRLVDGACEKTKGEKKIGTTGKGIGPTYTDHISRTGLLIKDIFDDDFIRRYDELTIRHLRLIMNEHPEEQPKDLTEDTQQFIEAVEFMKEFQIVDGPYWLDQQLKAGKTVLAEGAQGTLLDINFGTYPFVTSSNTTIGGVCTGLGIAANRIGKVYGLFKAYCTRVGSGPFPTELFDDIGSHIQQKGNEFGATTGRPRRCGWLDLPKLKYACMINGVTDLVMSKSDVLSDLDIVNVCIDYGKDETPIYQGFEGWKDDLQCTSDMLPQRLKDYMSFIEKKTETPITVVSTGPDRKQLWFI